MTDPLIVLKTCPFASLNRRALARVLVVARDLGEAYVKLRVARGLPSSTLVVLAESDFYWTDALTRLPKENRRLVRLLLHNVRMINVLGETLSSGTYGTLSGGYNHVDDWHRRDLHARRAAREEKSAAIVGLIDDAALLRQLVRSTKLRASVREMALRRLGTDDESLCLDVLLGDLEGPDLQRKFCENRIDVVRVRRMTPRLGKSRETDRNHWKEARRLAAVAIEGIDSTDAIIDVSARGPLDIAKELLATLAPPQLEAVARSPHTRAANLRVVLDRLSDSGLAKEILVDAARDVDSRSIAVSFCDVADLVDAYATLSDSRLRACVVPRVNDDSNLGVLFDNEHESPIRIEIIKKLRDPKLLSKIADSSVSPAELRLAALIHAAVARPTDMRVDPRLKYFFETVKRQRMLRTQELTSVGVCPGCFTADSSITSFTGFSCRVCGCSQDAPSMLAR